MLSLAGPVAEISAYATTTSVHRMETEDLVCAAVRFGSGALGVIEATTSAYPGFPERIEITGETATALLAGTKLQVLHHDGRVTEVAPDSTPGGTGADPMAFPHDYHRALLTDFLDALDQGREPAVNGEQALEVHRLIDALLQAATANRPVKVG
jgi:predicted dehydrogenase